MNRTILPFLFFLFSFGITAHTQVIIDQSNFPRPAGFVDTFALDFSFQTLPSEGPDQVWDYSALQRDDTRSRTYTDATDDAQFSDALNYNESFLSFQGLPIPRLAYDGVDESGYYQVGSAISEIGHSITAISGGANDTLRFLGEKTAFEGRIDYLQFPVTYEKQWTGSNIERINLELTVGAFGLDKTPGQLKREETQHREVVGYGKLVIPQADGTPSAPTPVLLIKVEETYVDSFFLGGAPAPAAILGAFGLTQGVSINSSLTHYLFYRPGFGSPLLSMAIFPEQGLISMVFRSEGAEMTTSIDEIRWSALKSFPNPVRAGHSMVIQTKNPTPIGYFQLSDLSGRIVHQQSFEAPTNRQFSIQIPANTNPGLYFYHLFGQHSEPIGRGKLQVN